MSRFQGFAELRVPLDLVRKLEYDLERILKSPQDQNAAFDFFVTAEHIVDWIHPDDATARTTLRSSSSLLKVTSHLANGAKHFEAKAKHHRSVTDVEKSTYVATGYIEDGYTEESLIVHLSAEEQQWFGNCSIEVAALARQVYEYWKANAPES